MLAKFTPPDIPEIQEVFGTPEQGTYKYKQEGNITEAQAWFRCLRRIVGDVVSLPSVALFVPVSRNAIHKRVNEGYLSCFKFQILDPDKKVSASRKRERPHAFVPIKECIAWQQEFHDRALLREGHTAVDFSAEALFDSRQNTEWDEISCKYENAWEEAYREFLQEYTIQRQKLSNANKLD